MAFKPTPPSVRTVIDVVSRAPHFRSTRPQHLRSNEGKASGTSFASQHIIGKLPQSFAPRGKISNVRTIQADDLSLKPSPSGTRYWLGSIVVLLKLLIWR